MIIGLVLVELVMEEEAFRGEEKVIEERRRVFRTVCKRCWNNCLYLVEGEDREEEEEEEGKEEEDGEGDGLCARKGIKVRALKEKLLR